MLKFWRASMLYALICLLFAIFIAKYYICAISNASSIISSVCNSSHTVGNFCWSICTSNNEGCFLFHASKELVQSASDPADNKYVIKQKVSEAISEEYIQSLLSFHEEDSPIVWFQNLLRGLVQYEIEPDDERGPLQLLWPWQTADNIFTESDSGRTPVQILRFAHNDEYKLLQLYRHVHVFPHVIGTCGDVYAVELVEPLFAAPWLDVLPAVTDGCRAATGARRVLQYLRRLQDVIPAGLHLCDLKWSHFGLAADGSVRFLDLDSAFTDRKMAATQAYTACSSDDDCHFFECRGTCDTSRGFCHSAVSDNVSNLCRQLIWPRVPLLGNRWRLGLLAHMLQEEEASLLERCALQGGESTTDDVEVMLLHMEQRGCKNPVLA